MGEMWRKWDLDIFDSVIAIQEAAQIKIGLGGFQWVMKTKQSSPPIPINKILTNVHTELLKKPMSSEIQE